MMAAGSTQSERSGIVALLAAGISAAAIALLALLGWVLDAPALTAWGADTIPMAPSAAALSVLVGAALALCAPMRPRSGALRLATLAGWVGAVAALLLLLLRLRGEYWPVEHLGLPIGGTFRGAAVGYISPITASCFLLANAVLLALLPAGARGSWRRWLAWSFGGLISVMGFALLLAYAFGAPLLFREAFIPPAFNTSLILLIVGLALLLLAGRLSREPRVSPEGAPKGRLVFVVMFVGFAAATITGGYSYYRQEERELRGEAGRQLDVVARLKATEVSHWRKERLADATVMLRSAFLSASFEHFLQRPGDAAMVGQLQEWLGSYQAYGQYDRAFLIDAHGATRLSLPAPADPPSAAISRRASEVLRTGQVALQDFYLDERDQRVHLAILAPILDRSGASRPIGVLVLRIDPESFLYPFIESWPATSTTAEALLVRRDGADVLYLSDLRFDPNAALRRRIPLENARVLAVRAVLGETGGVNGLDYRGAPVLGSLHPIPDSPWYLIAHVDIAEFRAQLWDRVWRVIAFTIALLLGGGSALGLIGWNQRTRFYRKQAELTSALRASEERFRGFIENASDIVYGLTPGGIFTYVSPNWLDLMGEPATNAVGRSFEPYVHPDDVHLCKEFLERVLATGEPLGSVDYRALHRDGSTRWHSSKGSALRDRDGNVVGYVGIARDVTARKQAEAALRASLQEKEALLTEVHHRVKNNLQVITSLLRLEAGRSAHPATAAALGEMQSRIQSMALLHETLYRSGAFAQVDLSVYLTQLATHLFRSVAPPSGAIALNLNLASVHVDLEQAVPCGLLVNELVSNCLKHGFPDGRTGEVRIDLQPVDGGPQLRLQVRDTGVGLPADFEQRRAGSLGLQLVSDLARQLHGTLDIGRDPGALFSLVFTPRTSAPSSSQEK